MFSGSHETPFKGLSLSSCYHTPVFMVGNVMSLIPKIDQVQEFIFRNNTSIIFSTETWLKSLILDIVVDIPGYTIIRRDREHDDHGSVCIYFKKNNFRYKVSKELSCCNKHEPLWM